MSSQAPIQTELQCAACGGQCAFAPRQDGLVCQSCGTLRTLDAPGDQTASTEFPYDPDVPRQEVAAIADTRAHQCQTCGGEIVFTGPALSERCPYCDGPVVLGAPQSAFDTMALVPFKIAEETALENARAWLHGRYAAPGDLPDVVKRARIAGLYAPFWTFDSHEALDYRATYVTGTGKKRRRRTLSGRMTTQFDDLLVPASDHVTPMIRDGILHDFRPNRLRPYRAGYLAGFAAERHHQTVAQGLAANAADKGLLIRARIKDRIAKSRVTSVRYQTDTTGIHYRRILLPVWILHYSYAGKAHKVVVSGIDGRTYGERPFSRYKLMAYAAFLAAIAIGAGLAWGSASML